MSYERISDDPMFDGHVRDSHEYRYEVASRFTTPQDIVLDAACGTGYGRKILRHKKYVGADRADLCDNLVVDLNTWKPDFDYDVMVSLETIEHIDDYTQLVENLKRAKKYFVVSAPIIPTKHRNPYHVHDFTKDSLKELFGDCKLVHEEEQLGIYSILVYKTGGMHVSV